MKKWSWKHISWPCHFASIMARKTISCFFLLLVFFKVHNIQNSAVSHKSLQFISKWQKCTQLLFSNNFQRLVFFIHRWISKAHAHEHKGLKGFFKAPFFIVFTFYGWQYENWRNSVWKSQAHNNKNATSINSAITWKYFF